MYPCIHRSNTTEQEVRFNFGFGSRKSSLKSVAPDAGKQVRGLLTSLQFFKPIQITPLLVKLVCVAVLRGVILTLLVL